VTIFWRCLVEHRALWRLWLPLLLLSSLLPFVVLAMPLIERQLIDQVLLASRVDLLVPYLAAYAALWLLSSVCQVMGAVLRTALSEQLMVHLRERLFVQCTRLSVAFARSLRLRLFAFLERS